MLIGSYQHSIDCKGRLNFPVKLREDLGESFVVTKGLDNCLAVYRLSDWEKLSERASALPTSKARKIQRFLFGGACEVTPDKQGRVLIPQGLRDYAGLIDDIMVVGQSKRVEIWELNRWVNLQDDLTSDAIADLMDELDF